MSLNETSNLLLGAGQYRHSPAQYHHHHSNSINDDPHHPDVESVSYANRLSASTQSPAEIVSSTIVSTSDPQLEQCPMEGMFAPISSSALTSVTLPTAGNHVLTLNSLRQVDNACFRRKSNPKIASRDENAPDVRKKSSGDCILAMGLSKGISIDQSTQEEHEHDSTEKEPIEIRVRCIFSRVAEIDTLNERYTAEIFFEASWYEKSHRIGSKYDPQMGHFNPQLVVLNHIGDTLRHEKWYSVRRTKNEDPVEITEHHKIRGVFWERMELNHFPYDVQELSVSITTPLETKDLYFIQNNQKASGVNRTVFSDQQSWHLYEHVEFDYENHREEYSLNYNQIHPVVVCTCHVGRKCGYYIWNAYFLIFLITSASLCTFAIPPSNTHGRLQITCTLLLTSVTFRWVVNKSLPTISYLTALDVYAISSIVVLCIINVFHGIISYIYYNQIYLAASQASVTTSALHLSLYPDYSLCRIDRYAFFIFLSSFCLYQILILLWTFWVPYKRRRAMSHKDELNRTQLTHKTNDDLIK